MSELEHSVLLIARSIFCRALVLVSDCKSASTFHTSNNQPAVCVGLSLRVGHADRTLFIQPDDHRYRLAPRSPDFGTAAL